MYYYSIDGATFGPFTLEQLLENINEDTLVYREGIDWTNAKNVEELKKYFIKENINVIIPNINNKNIDFEPVIQYKPMFKAPFSFDGRIRRLEYGVSLIIYYLLYLFVFAICNTNSFFGIFLIPIIWFALAQGAKRCHDRGNSGWYQLIPFYVFWMLFAEGDYGNNEYGNNPKL
jgi:uncharacterized membrane protein YhaH (DUF805 family)